MKRRVGVLCDIGSIWRCAFGVVAPIRWGEDVRIRPTVGAS